MPPKITATARTSIMPRNFAIGSTKDKARIKSLPPIRRQFPSARTQEAGGHTPTSQEVKTAMKEETKAPVSRSSRT